MSEDYLSNQFRKDLITESVLHEEFPPDRAYMLFGLVASLESGESLIEAIEGIERKHQNDEKILETLDLASAWIREKQSLLRLYID